MSKVSDSGRCEMIRVCYHLTPSSHAHRPAGFFNRDFVDVKNHVTQCLDLIDRVKNNSAKLQQKEQQLGLDQLSVMDIWDCFVEPGNAKKPPAYFVAVRHISERIVPGSTSDMCGWMGDAAGALVILFVLGFFPRFTKVPDKLAKRVLVDLL